MSCVAVGRGVLVAVRVTVGVEGIVAVRLGVGVRLGVAVHVGVLFVGMVGDGAEQVASSKPQNKQSIARVE